MDVKLSMDYLGDTWCDYATFIAENEEGSWRFFVPVGPFPLCEDYKSVNDTARKLLAGVADRVAFTGPSGRRYRLRRV